jgi:hypothetical protein
MEITMNSRQRIKYALQFSKTGWIPISQIVFLADPLKYRGILNEIFFEIRMSKTCRLNNETY